METADTKIALLEQNLVLMNQKLENLEKGMIDVQSKLDSSILASNVAISRLVTLQEVHEKNIQENKDGLKSAWRAVGMLFLTLVGSIAQAFTK